MELSSVVEKLEPAKQFIEKDREKYPLDYDQLSTFMSEAFVKSDVVASALTFTDDTDSLMDMLTDIYDKISDKVMKTRVTKLRNQLKNPGAASTTEDECGASESESQPSTRS
ncbi:hypothetical protein QAD02_019886 [Eretmocerus hayati]|uniref:Uncharacterized protein n=1 Tax=Eretmocerus hayati TaxID=131215 RepID=A0ACC2PNC3_9HYME|nr:hypothetical protein QAD02_019886 [Eretmocerus hayati]